MRLGKSGFEKPSRTLLASFAIGVWIAGTLFGSFSIERLIEDRAIRLIITGQKGDTWAIEFSDDLELWQGLGEAGLVVLDDSGRGELVITPSTETQFYRASLLSNPNSLTTRNGVFSEESTLNIEGLPMSLESANEPNHSSR